MLKYRKMLNSSENKLENVENTKNVFKQVYKRSSETILIKMFLKNVEQVKNWVKRELSIV